MFRFVCTAEAFSNRFASQRFGNTLSRQFLLDSFRAEPALLSTRSPISRECLIINVMQ